MTAESQIREILRSADELKAVLEVTLVVSSDNIEEVARDARNRRVLAVVAHKDDWDLTEEGCLFVCKYKPSTAGQPEELEIQCVFPIYGEFSIHMSQMRRGTLDLRPTLPAKAVLEQPRAVITLNINPADGLVGDIVPPAFFTHDVETLRTLVTESKRLKEVSDVEAKAVINLAQSTTHFSWLKPYFAKRITIAALTNLPEDLRQANRPLLERLSPSAAGLTNDDHADVELIREDWIRRQAQDLSRKGQRNLTLRLGTFNVNGKMPSQDLSAWIQGNIGTKPSSLRDGISSAPHTEKVSPLSLGDIVKTPLNWVKRKHNRTAPTGKAEIPIRVDAADPDEPDMLVLSFQELDLSTEALIYSTSTYREDAWSLAIFAALGEKAVKYEKLVSRQLVGMLIIIIVKKSLKNSFSDVETTAAGAGILGVMGNKGGTAIRLTFAPPLHSTSETLPVRSPGPTTFTFVNAHLAAFDEMTEKRNSDYQDLSKRLTFEHSIPPSSLSPEGTGGDANDVIVDSGADPLGLTHTITAYETDVLFWMVNLNYRVDIPDLDLRRLLTDNEWENGLKLEALLRFDQLKKAMLSKKAFELFQEAPITHMPTYRFSLGLGMDKLGYDLKRKPAWTDRILFMHGSACTVKQTSYTSHPQVLMSDHRPVAADFSVEVNYYDSDEYHSYVQKLFNEAAHLEGESAQERGGLKIEDTYIDFDKVFYDKPVEKTVSVKNTGKSLCAFRFVPIQIDAPIHPEWLQIHPVTGILRPDERIQITLTARVDNSTASLLNMSPKDLSGTLICHTLLGKDHFISVSGEYQYTCFANKLTRLTRLRGPIRSLQSPNDLLPEGKAISAPREIMRLINWMMAHSNPSEGMFLLPGSEDTIIAIRDCLDTGEEFPYSPNTTDAHLPLSFAVTLLRFLDSLSDPIIPAALHSRCLEARNRDEAFELLDGLPAASVNVWISITAFLHSICKSSDVDGHTERIASVLAPILLRDDPESLVPPISPSEKRKYLLYFIS